MPWTWIDGPTDGSQWISLHQKMRFDLNPSCMPAEIFLTASACFVLCTGLYALIFIAIVLTGCLTVLTGIAHHRCAAHTISCPVE